MGINNNSISASYQSTDASTNPALIFPFPQNSSGKFTCSILAFDSSQNTASWEIKFTGKRLTGNCIQVGSMHTISSDADSALSTASVSVSIFGSSFVVNVAGVNATTINWDLSLQAMYDNL